MPADSPPSGSDMPPPPPPPPPPPERPEVVAKALQGETPIPPMSYSDFMTKAATSDFEYTHDIDQAKRGDLDNVYADKAQTVPVSDAFSGGQYEKVVLDSDVVMYQAGSANRGVEGGAAEHLGCWFSPVEPGSQWDAMRDSAIRPNWPNADGYPTRSNLDTVYAVTVPAGTTVYAGPVSYQSDAAPGNQGIQVYMPRESLANATIESTSALKPGGIGEFTRFEQP